MNMAHAQPNSTRGLSADWRNLSVHLTQNSHNYSNQSVQRQPSPVSEAAAQPTTYEIYQVVPPMLFGFSTYSTIIITVIAVFLDILILGTFFHRRRLITPFAIHIVNLTVIELTRAALYTPLLMGRDLNRNIFRGTRPLCLMYKYLQWTSGFLAVQQHVVICIDRWLAVQYPIWYRTKTVRFGLIATGVIIIYQHLIYMPLFVPDALVSIPANQLCDVTQVFLIYQQVVRAMGWLVPQFLLYVSYPFLLYKIWSRRPKKSTPQGGMVQDVDPDGTGKPAPLQQEQAAGPAKSAAPQKRLSKQSNSELYLALSLVVLQLIVWGPEVIVSMISSTRLPIPYVYDVFAYALNFENVLLFVEPLVYLVFLKDLRRQVRINARRLLGCPAPVARIVPVSGLNTDETGTRVTGNRSASISVPAAPVPHGEKQ